MSHIRFVLVTDGLPQGDRIGFEADKLCSTTSSNCLIFLASLLGPKALAKSITSESVEMFPGKTAGLQE